MRLLPSAKNSIEKMLANQAVAAHHMAIKMLARALETPRQTCGRALARLPSARAPAPIRPLTSRRNEFVCAVTKDPDRRRERGGGDHKHASNAGDHADD